MKKSVLLTAVLLIFPFLVEAQGIKFGIKGGVNFAELNGDDIESNIDGRTGYHIGAVAQISLAGFAIQPEVIYSTEGVVDVDYLNVPILFKKKFAKIISIEVGPQFGFAIDDNPDLGNPESFDLSGAVGVGVEISKFFAQLRYNFGFTEALENSDVKNAIFQVSVGYYIF